MTHYAIWIMLTQLHKHIIVPIKHAVFPAFRLQLGVRSVFCHTQRVYCCFKDIHLIQVAVFWLFLCHSVLHSIQNYLKPNFIVVSLTLPFLQLVMMKIAFLHVALVPPDRSACGWPSGPYLWSAIPVNSNLQQKRSLIAPCCFLPVLSAVCAVALKSCRDLRHWVWYVTATASPIAYSSVYASGHTWVSLPLPGCQRETFLKCIRNLAYLGSRVAQSRGCDIKSRCC